MTGPRTTHDAVGLSRADRRRFERLCAKVDKILDTDRRFFQRHPNRRHRVRIAAPVEIEASAMLGLPATVAGDGCRWFAVIKRFSPGVRGRMLFSGPADNDTDVTEAEATWLYERQMEVSAEARALDRQLRELSASLQDGNDQKGPRP